MGSRVFLEFLHNSFVYVSTVCSTSMHVSVLRELLRLPAPNSVTEQQRDRAGPLFQALANQSAENPLCQKFQHHETSITSCPKPAAKLTKRVSLGCK